uniref:Uncharacterized protein n=1 Tax=Romanomermis culicivorax TaxID=13658 RepID=A0A915IIU0_ROMCU
MYKIYLIRLCETLEFLAKKYLKLLKIKGTRSYIKEGQAVDDLIFLESTIDLM